MTAMFHELEDKARSLPVDERAMLVDILLASLLDPPAAEIKAAWDREIADRVAAFNRGELTTFDAASVLAEARQLAR